MFCRPLFVLLYFFLLTIVLSVLLRYTDSDYPFGIFKLFFQIGIIGVYVCFNTLLVKICRLANLDRRQYIFKGLIILFVDIYPCLYCILFPVNYHTITTTTAPAVFMLSEEKYVQIVIHAQFVLCRNIV